MSIQATRVKNLNNLSIQKKNYLLYWMQQSQRAEYNHALEYAVSQANHLNLPVLAIYPPMRFDLEMILQLVHQIIGGHHAPCKEMLPHPSSDSSMASIIRAPRFWETTAKRHWSWKCSHDTLAVCERLLFPSVSPRSSSAAPG